MSERDDLAACAALLADGSRTFQAASWLLPHGVRADASALYAFCRTADDLVDASGAPGIAVGALRHRLARVYGDEPLEAPVDRALRHVVRRHRIAPALPEALIEGFEWDAEGRQYDTLAELHAYAARVAGSVGAMMARLMGATDVGALARACDLGVAMQLSNIARDVGEDARRGRLYLPLQWLREAGIEPQTWLACPRFDPALAAVLRRLLAEADRLYARAADGLVALPASCRPAINVARHLYRQIGLQVARNGYDAVDRRAVVGRGRKLLWALRALAESPTARGTVEADAPLDAVVFLLRDADIAKQRNAPVAWWRLPTRAIGIIELFDRLERRRRLAAAASPAGWGAR